MTHDQLKSAIRQRMAETGEPYMVARRECLRQRDGSGEQASPPDVTAAPDMTSVMREVAAAQHAAANVAARAAGLGEVAAAHQAALNLSGSSADLTNAEREAARQAAADLAASAAGLAEVIAAHQSALEFGTGSIDLTDVGRSVTAANQAAFDLAGSSADFKDRLTEVRGAAGRAAGS
jgi:hypothetical protein